MAMKSKFTTTSGLNALVWQEENLFVAKALEVELASQGKTAKEALSNLEEAIELYFEDEGINTNSVSLLLNPELRQIYPKILNA